MLYGPWRIEMLGGLRLQQGDRTITRFQTEKTGALLALLALFPHRSHARQEISAVLWPDAPFNDPGKNLRVALTSLRHQLEPTGVPHGSVLIADRIYMRLNPDAFTTDVADFEAALQQAKTAPDPAEQARLLTKALELYRGELLPGYYVDPIPNARERLNTAYREACLAMAALRRQSGEIRLALDVALRAQQSDLLDATALQEVMRLYEALGQPDEAMRHFDAYALHLKATLGEAPDPELCALAERVRALRSSVPPRPPTSPSGSETRQETVPLAPVPEPHLPMTLNPFFGREDEMTRLLAMLKEIHLITLMGLGGTGKTRLATEVAHRALERFDNAVWFVPLADLIDPALIVEAIQAAMQLKRSPEIEPLAQVVAALQQPSLLVLDNFEQLVAGGANIVQSLRQRCPLLTLLVTSRRRLGLAGERIFPLAPLPLPKENEAPEQLTLVASVQLYIDRAQAARPDFELTQVNADTVALLCRKLEGIPLAIELAAARASAFTPAQMLEFLTERFTLLSTRRRDREARHASLWAAMAWSYDMLSLEQQRLFAALSVFRGGFSLSAADAVCASDQRTADEPDSQSLQRTAERLSQLQSCSLVLTQDRGTEFRYYLLETVREFAAAQLTRLEQEALYSRHLDYFLQQVITARTPIRSPQPKEWLDRLEMDHDNFRAALAWSLTKGQIVAEGNEREKETVPPTAEGAEPSRIERGLQLVGDLWFFWDTRYYHLEGIAWIKRMLASSREAPAALRINALNGAGNLAYHRGDYAAARRMFKQCLDLRQSIGDKKGIAASLGSLGNVLIDEQDYPLARKLLERSLVLFEQLQDERGISLTLANLGRIYVSERDYETAVQLYRQSQEMFRKTGNRWNLVLSLNNLVSTLLLVEKEGEVPDLLTEAMALAQDLGHKRELAHSLTNSIYLARQLGHMDRAAVLSGAEDAYRRQIDFPLPPTDHAMEEYARAQASVRLALGDAPYEEAYACGQAMTLEESLDYVRATFPSKPTG